MFLVIRKQTGKRNIILKLLITDSIAMVYKYVRPYTEGKNIKFELRTTFPNKAYSEDDPKNLKELGLAPSSALIIR